MQNLLAESTRFLLVGMTMASLSPWCLFIFRRHDSGRLDSRLRGNDGTNANNVIPAKAGIQTASTEHGRVFPGIEAATVPFIPRRSEATPR